MIDLQQHMKASINSNDTDQPWLKQLRLDALARFEKIGFPTLKNEDWKYTDIAPITNNNFKVVTKKAAITEEQIAQFLIPELDCYQLVFIDGLYHDCNFILNDLPNNLIIQPMAVPKPMTPAM